MTPGTTVAAPAKPQMRVGVLRAVFSFPVAISALLVVLATLVVARRFADPDMWWHLKMGQVIWTSHHIPRVDLFSYTTNHHAYIAHEWLSQVFLYAAYRVGGYSGVMLWLCGMTAAILIAGYALSSLYSGNAKVALVGALILFVFGTIGFSVRAQMVGYLLLIAELMLLHLGRTRDSRWFYALPPLFALWVNCHASFSFGLLVAAVILGSSWLEFEAGAVRAVRWAPARSRTLLIALGLSLLALYLNPIGPKLVSYPFQIIFHSPVNLNAVTEWQPLRLNDARGIGFLALLTGIPLLAACGKATLYLDEILLLAISGIEAAEHERLIFVFGIIVAPIIARVLASHWPGYDRRRDHPVANVVLIAASALVSYAAFPTPGRIAQQIDGNNPTKALAYIREHHVPGPMFNEYVYGGYLIWAAPEYPVFVDGRTDIFEWTGVLSEYGEAVLLQSDPAALLDKYHVNFCLLRQDSPLRRVLPLIPGWKIVYSDEVAFVAVRDAQVPAGIVGPRH